MVAGLAAALCAGASLDETARLGLAFAAAKLGRIGPHLPDARAVRAFAEAASLSEFPASQVLGNSQ
jgi:1-phosphofructokinase